MTPEHRHYITVSKRLKLIQHDELIKNEMLLEENRSVYWVSGWMDEDEAEILYDIACQEKVEHIFESGTCNGFSAMWLSLVGCPVTTFDPIDKPKVWDLVGGKPDNVTYIQSDFAALDCKDLKGKKLFFIDGDHGFEYADEDAFTALLNSSSGDVIVFHDLHYRAIKQVFKNTIEEHGVSHEQYKTRYGMGKVILK